ncbi:MAG: glutamine synthetase III [Spirochaetes bacterium]|nr:glutamine synthetase III [Spirochaetota bacterium]
MAGRKETILEITENRKLSSTIDNDVIKKPVADYYGMNCFNDEAMRKFLPYNAYLKLKKIIKEGENIDGLLAEEVAHGMKEWAISKGASHYTHWFQPLTGLTAEKHDSFLSFSKDGLPINRFSGKNLSQGEPDASSFPSGGLRATFEARGYTAWDPTSPAFLVETSNGATLCIPSVFLSYTGEALDKKTPLLRSMEKLNDVALRMLHLFGNKNVTEVNSTVGPEQEYFLIDKLYFNQRPDLMLTGRTLFGAKPPKGQEMEDHYFGSIRERVLIFMQDVEARLFKLGIPIKTRHNEVAPAQFEIAAIFEGSNVATDHNQLIMETLRKVANRHNLALLLHEKPFAGINGSGKHNNWSLSDSEGSNLLEPGRTPHDNLQFLTFLMATIKAVYKYSDLLRAAIASAGNDHRLGANEAPPAIISVFLGEQLSKILDNLEGNKKTDYSDKDLIDLGISNLPLISKDNTDRNRTSPFAFTGNKFEFRAVGSADSVSPANFIINTIVCSELDDFANKISSNLKKGMDLNKAVLEVIIPVIKETKPIRFEGNNYDPAWEKEAEKRGLPNKKTTPESLKDYLAPKNIEVFTKTKILNEREIEARYQILLEKYSKTINIEAETALSMARTMILPVAIKYQSILSDAVGSLSKVKGADPKVVAHQVKSMNSYSGLVVDLDKKISTLAVKLKKAVDIKDEVKKADAYCKDVLPATFALREVADSIELQTDDSLWVLPKYQEMLFIY